MSLRQTLAGSLVEGLLEGVVPSVWGTGISVPTPLLTLDFSSAPTQSFSTANATSEWYFQEASGTIYDQIGNYDLSSFGGTYYHNQPAYGIGSDLTSRKAFELEQSANGYAQLASSSGLDADGTSIGIRVVFRCLYPYGGTLIYKRDLAGSSDGYSLSFNTSGHLTLTVHDGTSFVQAAVTGNHCDAAWHYVDLVIDETADEIRLRTDLGTATTSKSSLGAISSTLQNFTLGDAGAGVNAPQVQYTYMAAIEGAAAESLDAESFWTHGNDPTGLLSSYSRSSVITSEVDEGILCAYGTNQYAPMWSSAYRGASDIAMATWPAATNLLQRSCETSNATWGKTNCNFITGVNVTTGPDGFRTADRMFTTSTNGYISQSVTTTASTDYVFSIYIKEHPTFTAQPGRIIIHDGTSEVASEFFLTTNKWQRIWVTGNHSGTTTEVRLELDNGNVYADLTHAQLETGTVPTPPIVTTTASATRAATNVSVSTLVSNSYIDHAQGEIETLAAPLRDSVSVYLLDAKGGTAGDQKEVYIDANQQPVFDVADSSGTAAQSCGGASAAIVEGSELFRGRYDAASGVDGNSENADLVVDGIRDAGTASTWTSGSTEQTLYLGRDASSAGYLSGSIQHIKIWGSPQAEGSFGWNKFDDEFGVAVGGAPEYQLNDNWQHFQPQRVPEVTQYGGRYRAKVRHNLNDETLWYGSSQGRFDYKTLSFPFEVIAYNIGIGTIASSQTPPGWDAGGATWFFCGLMVHVDDLATVSYQASLCGHRGTTHHTIEQKNTLAGSSSVTDEGIDAVPNGRADLRVVGSGGVCTFYWRLPGDTSWTASANTGFSIPTYGSTVKVGIVTYAYLGYGGLPFVGTCDSIVLV